MSTSLAGLLQGGISLYREEIEGILPHRGKMLFLDQVMIEKGVVFGEFTFSDENCEGHELMPSMKIVRGVDVVEMAFQLLGVFCSQNPALVEKSEGKIYAARGIRGAVFNGLIKPGDKVVLEMSTEINIQNLSGIIIINSGRIVARVADKRKCTIASIKIVAFDPRLVSTRTG